MVSELTVILGDFFLPARARQAVEPSRLPALELLLARAQRSRLPGGWRAWLAHLAAPADLAAMPAPRIAAHAWLDAPPASDAFWFATPVHYLAGIDSVHLHPAGLLTLADEEQTVLAADFNALYADAPWRLHALGRRELLLRGPRLDASAADPGDWAGRDPSGGAPRGADANTLRRLGSEIEMWLHEHPLNLQRRARAQLAVTGLWLWGVPEHRDARADAADRSAPSAARTRGAVPVLYGADLYAEGLWRLAGLTTHALPDAFDARQVRADAHSVVLFPVLGTEGLTQLMKRLEQRWIAPALAAVRTGRLATLQLIAGQCAYRLRRRSLVRFWRARAPWWEAFA